MHLHSQAQAYGEEIKRHNLAMEQFVRARQEWNQKEIEQRHKQLELGQERSDANEQINVIALRLVVKMMIPRNTLICFFTMIIIIV